MICVSPNLSFAVGLIARVQPERLEICAYGDAGDAGVPGESISPLLAGRKVVVGPPLVVDLADLQSRGSWAERTVWYLSLQENLMISPPLNYTELFPDSRTGWGAWFQSTRTLLFATVLVPYRDSNFREMGLMFHTHPNFPLIGETALSLPYDQLMSAVYPRLVLEGPESIAAGGRGTFSVRVLDATGASAGRPVRVYLESTAGRVSHHEAVVTNEKSFVVSLEDVAAGEDCVVRAGFKYHRAFAEKTVKVGGG